MRKLGIYLLTLFVVCSFSLVAQDNSQADEIKINRITVDNAGFRSHSIMSEIAEFEEDGKKMIMIVWSEETGLKNIYYSKKENRPDATWSTPARASFTAVNSKTPDIVVDPNNPGVVHMVWADGETRNSKDIFHSRYFDKAWHGMTRLISHANNDSLPKASVLADGTIEAAWEYVIPNPVTKQFDNTYLRSGNTWTINADRSVWDTKGHGISTNSNHHATHVDIYSRGVRSYAVWQEGVSGAKVAMFSEKIMKEGHDDHWTWPIRVSTLKHSAWPEVVADSHENVHVIWAELGGKYGYNRRIYGKWLDVPEALNHYNAKRDLVEIDIDANDMLYAVYRGDAVNTYYSYKSANNLGRWSVEQKISNGKECTYATLLANNSSDYFHVTWSDIPAGASHSMDIWYASVKKKADWITDYPNADFTMSASSTTIVKNTEVTFDASPSTSPGGAITSYHWNFGDLTDLENNYSEQKVVSYTYPEEGIYKVTLSILDKQRGLIGNKTVELEVINGPLPPTGVTISTFMNKGFLYRDWINKIEWTEDPSNANLGFSTEAIHIHRRQVGTNEEWAEIAQLGPSETHYYDKGYVSAEDAQAFEYGVSITAGGIKSTIATVNGMVSNQADKGGTDNNSTDK